MRTLANAAIAIAILAFVAAPSQAEPKAGEQAPAFTMAGSDGQMHSLADYKGKQVVVLAWFPKAFTPGCTAECKSLRDEGEEVRKFDVAYFTASCDTPEKNTDFSKSLELDFPILSDPTQEVAKAYGVVHGERKVPERWTYYIGTDGKVLFVDKEVKTKSHGADVAAKLKELGVAEKK